MKLKQKAKLNYRRDRQSRGNWEKEFTELAVNSEANLRVFPNAGLFLGFPICPIIRACALAIGNFFMGHLANCQHPQRVLNLFFKVLEGAPMCINTPTPTPTPLLGLKKEKKIFWFLYYKLVAVGEQRKLPVQEKNLAGNCSCGQGNAHNMHIIIPNILRKSLYCVFRKKTVGKVVSFPTIFL